MLNLKKTDPSKAAEAGYEFKIVLPDGTPTDAKIKVRGQNSAIVREFGRKFVREQQMKANAAKKRNKEAEEMTLEELEELNIKSAAVRIMSWTGLNTDDENGKEVPFLYSKENAEALMTDFPYIRDQVVEASNEVINFPC